MHAPIVRDAAPLYAEDMLRLLLLIVLSTAAANPLATATPLEVMAFNIRYGTANDGANRWERRRDLVIGVLEDHAPHVVGLQEALRFQLDEIAAACSRYGEIGVGRSDGREAGEYAAILYDRERLAPLASGTFWLSETPQVPGSMSWGNRITRICTWAHLADRETGARFYLYNIHFDHQSAASRAHSAELVAARIASRAHADPIILMGDFNAGESSAPIRFLRGEAERAVQDDARTSPPALRLRDTLRTVHPDVTDDGTFGAWTGRRDGERIDWIFVSESFTVQDAAIVHDNAEGRYPSDHFPVRATLTLPTGTRPSSTAPTAGR